MELPNWIVDEVLPPAKPAAWRVIVYLFRHGRPVAGRKGERRVYWRGSTIALARACGLSQRALLEAEHYLAEQRAIILHERTSNRAPHAISAPVDRPTADNLSAVAELLTAPHAAAPSTGKYLNEEQMDSIAETQRLPNVSTLADRAEVNALPAWLAKWGADRVERALAYALSDPSVRNPAGLAYRLLTAGDAEHLPEPDRRDPIAAARARYLAPVDWWSK